MKKYLTLALALLLTFPQFLLSQTITGKVTGTSGEALASVNVVLLSLNDTAFINGVTTDSLGCYSIDTKGISGFLRFSMIGYSAQTVIPNRQGVINVSLCDNEKMLGEVVVHSDLPQTKLTGEGAIITVAGSMLEKVGTLEQLLNYIPKVSADNGDIEVFGRGMPDIYVNGRKVIDKAELEHLYSNNIKDVEVITNPGVRYSASVKSIIRITTKKAVGDGWGIDAKATAGMNEQQRSRWTGDVTLNYHRRKFDLSANLSGIYKHTQDDKLLRAVTYLQDTWQQNNTIKQEYKRINPYGSLSASYSLDTGNSFGASIIWDRAVKNGSKGFMDGILTKNGNVEETSHSDYNSTEHSKEITTNAYYVGKVGNIGIDFNMDCYWDNPTNRMNVEEQILEGEGEPYSEEVNTLRKEQRRQFASKLVLSAPLFGGEFTFGTEYSFAKRKCEYTVLPENIVDNEHNTIKENMLSAFCDYSKLFGKLTAKVGLRYEYVDFNYYDHDIYVTEQSKNYNNLFPSVTLSYPVGKTQMQLTYASNISRPSYYQLRSGIQYDNRYTYEAGNPFLLPSISHNLEYDFSWKWIDFSYTFTHNINTINSIVQPYNGNGKILLMRPENLDSYNEMDATVVFSPTFGIWQPELEMSLFKQWFFMENHDNKSLGNPFGAFRFSNVFDTKWLTASVELSAITGGNQSNSLSHAYWRTDASLSKTFFKDRLILQLDAKDIFGTADQYVILYSGKQATTHVETYYSSNVTLTIRYKFNASKNKYKGSGAGKQQRARM